MRMVHDVETRVLDSADVRLTSLIARVSDWFYRAMDAAWGRPERDDLWGGECAPFRLRPPHPGASPPNLPFVRGGGEFGVGCRS